MNEEARKIVSRGWVESAAELRRIVEPLTIDGGDVVAAFVLPNVTLAHLLRIAVARIELLEGKLTTEAEERAAWDRYAAARLSVDESSSEYITDPWQRAADHADALLHERRQRFPTINTLRRDT